MNSVDFCFWLQGYFEISGTDNVTPEQAQIIKAHLNLVFKPEIDPIRESQTTTPKETLNHLHANQGKGLNDKLIRC